MGSVWGIARVKDEADIIGSTVRHMLEQVDQVVVVDNASSDGTLEILHAIEGEDPHRVFVLEDPSVAYLQAERMTTLAAYAAERGAEWVVPFDADEAWYATSGNTVADQLRCEAALGTVIVEAQLFDHVATGVDPDAGDPLEQIGWRRLAAASLPKVAAATRPAVRIHQGNHGADYGGRSGGLVVRHFPYRSPEQLVSKVRNGAAAYAATNLPDDVGAHWRQYGALLDAHGPEALHDVFREWFWVADPTRCDDLIFDPCPTASRS